MFVKLILPALLEAKDPGFRPIKYALFPPLGLAALAGCLEDDDEVVLEDGRGAPLARYVSRERSLLGAPPLRRDLIDRRRYLCPNSLVVSRGCPHHCDFCYKDAFYAGWQVVLHPSR